MALIPIRIDRTSKPPLGTPLRSDGHWSVQGLVGAWAFNEGAGKSVFDAVSGGAGITKGGKPWVDPMGLYGDGAAPEGVFLQNNIPDHTSTTMICTGTFSTFSAAITLMCFRSAELTILATGVARTRLLTSSKYPFATSTALPATVTSLAATLSGVGIHPAVYVNGRMETSTSAAGSGLPSVQIYSSIGCAPNSEYSSPLNGCISSALRYNIILPTDRISSISANPWQIYEPETVWVEVGGGGEDNPFSGAIYGQSSASANLSTAVVLAAAAQGNATAQAALSTALELAAQVNGNGSATGALGADISGLAGSLHGSSEAQATLSTAIHLMGLAAGQCGVVGRLAEPVEILAQLRVMASDPLALTISVRDPLALRVTVH